MEAVHVDGACGTVDGVVEAMQNHSWIHLACHGTQDVASPLQSALCLHDGKLSLSQVISQSLPNAEFAFLSACQTAKGDDGLPDEVVHLAAGMLVAGYRGVVGTMWSIRDEDGPLIADEFYSRVCGEGKLDSREAAAALHFAVKRLQEGVGERNFLRWVPFVHFGW